MLMRTRGDMPTVQEKREYTSRLIRFAATQLAIVGWLAAILPATARDIPTSYQNTYRGCTGRLLNIKISPEDAAAACAEALRPSELSKCVVEIEQETEIAAGDALGTCRQVRRPNDVARCVVGISSGDKEAIPDVLDYCGRRTLLPTRFAECVVGLRIQAKVAAPQAMETCISASEPPRDFAPNFVPENRDPILPAPAAPSVTGDPTPLAEPNSAPGEPNQTPGLTPPAAGPQNQTSPPIKTPAPNAPAPGR